MLSNKWLFIRDGSAYNLPISSVVKKVSINTMGIPYSPPTFRYNRMHSVLRRAYERFIRIRGNPKAITFGLALGIFIGISPLVGFQLISAVLIAALLRWNKIAAAMGTLISNPIATPFIYTFAYYVGSVVMGTTTENPMVIPRELETARRMMEEASQFLLALTLGTVHIGLPFAVLGYFASCAALMRYRETIRENLNKRRPKLALGRVYRSIGVNRIRTRAQKYQAKWRILLQSHSEPSIEKRTWEILPLHIPGFSRFPWAGRISISWHGY